VDDVGSSDHSDRALVVPGSLDVVASLDCAVAATDSAVDSAIGSAGSLGSVAIDSVDNLGFGATGLAAGLATGSVGSWDFDPSSTFSLFFW
jgi:hypothetical protein